jgi:hypothetical protein
MTGKNKTMKGSGEDTKIIRMLKELDELYNLLTKQDQGMFNKVRFGSRLKDFFEILKKILSEHLLSKVYRHDLKTQLSKLLELFVKFKNISSIKNGGSQGILNLFRANILWMTQEAREMFTKLSQKITSNIYLLKNGHTSNHLNTNKKDIESVEYYFDFVIGLIRLLVTTFKKNTNTINSELEEAKTLFDIMIEQYLNYLHVLEAHPEYFPSDFKINNILSKRQLNTQLNFTNQKNKLKKTFFPNIKRVESLLSKNVIMNVLQKIKRSFNTELTPNQIQLKIKSLQQFKEKIKNSPLLEDADIKRLLTEIKNTVRTNNQSPQVTNEPYINSDNKYSKQYYSTNHKEYRPMINESIQEKNNRLRKANYNRILGELENKYRSNPDYDLTRLIKLAGIGSTIDSITRMPNSNNRNIQLKTLRETIKQSTSSLGNYPEFKEYERMILGHRN